MAITRIQFKTGTAAAATTISVTLDGAPSNGNGLVIAITTSGTSTGRVSSISQTGVTWTKAIEVAHASGPTSEIWYGLNASSASASITVNLAATLNAHCVVAEYSGLATSSALDKTASNTGTGGSAADSGTTATTTTNNQLWVASLGSALTSGAYLAPSNSFTEVAQLGDATLLLAFEEKIVSATGAANTSAAWSLGSEAEQWAGTIATFKEPASARRIFNIA